jgi:hypothetical protein
VSEAAGPDDARDDEAAGEARSRRVMGWALAWGVITLALLAWFARAYEY